MSLAYFETNFPPWMQRVDQIVFNRIGFSIYDFNFIIDRYFFIDETFKNNFGDEKAS